MQSIELLVFAFLLAIFAGSVATLVLVVVRLRSSPDDRPAQFLYSWLGAFGLFGFLWSCVGLASFLAEHTESSNLAVAGAVLVNLLAQPFVLLLGWSSIRKLGLGLFGHVVYAGARVPEEQLAGLPPGERRGLARYCVYQGVVG